MRHGERIWLKEELRKEAIQAKRTEMGLRQGYGGGSIAGKEGEWLKET